MNKTELVAEVHRLLGDGTSKAAAERAADSVLRAIKKGLRDDAAVHLVGFGTFSVAR
jgi:nucleoid DNA-binding protein